MTIYIFFGAFALIQVEILLLSLQYHKSLKKNDIEDYSELIKEIEKLSKKQSVITQDFDDLGLRFAKLHEFVQSGISTMATRASRAKKVAEEINGRMSTGEIEIDNPQGLPVYHLNGR